MPTLRLLPIVKEQPLYQQKPGVGLWDTYLPESKTVYANFRRYPKCSLLGSCEEFDALMKFVDEHYKFLDEDVPAVMPDKRIDPHWADFKAGRDPVMEWILSSK